MAPQIVEAIKKIEERGAREIAARSLQNVSQVFRYAIAHGLVTRLPTSSRQISSSPYQSLTWHGSR
ncbi:phage integrase central domain-containing protein [Edaphobacter sp. HDX4]|uniref:phage integrase central domain-containing protein n=1 Tax=Edaphobacter sp. HDX4 TaxID=2794064 RepID=UPI003FA5A693